MFLKTIMVGAVLLLAAGCSNDDCKTVHECDPGQRCVNFRCKASNESPGAVGDSCSGSGECAAGLSCNSPANGFPEGFCTATCDPAGAACASGTCTTFTTGSFCAASCSSDLSCRQGYSCCESMGNVCVPSAACGPAECKRPVVASAAPASQVILHEQHTVGDNVAFVVPAGTASISIVQQAIAANLEIVYQNQPYPNAAVPGFITRPDNTRVYDDNDQSYAPGPSPDGGVDPSGLYSYYEGSTPSTGAFTFPATSASITAGVPAGTWHFQVNDYAFECASGLPCQDGGTATNSYDVTVLAKPAPPATPTLDLAFYLVADGLPFTAANAADNAAVKRMVSTFTHIYGVAGITIGAVTFYDVTAGQRARFGTNVAADKTEPCDNLDQMFTISGEHPGNTLNLFLVQGIQQPAGQQGGKVVGIDGTIPGPSTFAGTIASGAAVSMVDLFTPPICSSPGIDIGGCGADEVAFIAAHEAGHFLGLFHTTEADGRFFDPLADTDKCPCTKCAASTDLSKCSSGGSASSPVIVGATRCVNAPNGCGAGSNLMFWQLSAAVSQGVLSDQQGTVIKLNPAVH